MKTILLATGGIQENIFQIMWQNTPLFAIVLQVALLSGYFVFLVMKLYQRFQKAEDKIKDHKVRVTTGEEKTASIEARMSKIETKLDMLINKVDFIANLVVGLVRQNQKTQSMTPTPKIDSV